MESELARSTLLLGNSMAHLSSTLPQASSAAHRAVAERGFDQQIFDAIDAAVLLAHELESVLSGAGSRVDLGIALRRAAEARCEMEEVLGQRATDWVSSLGSKAKGLVRWVKETFGLAKPSNATLLALKVFRPIDGKGKRLARSSACEPVQWVMDLLRSLNRAGSAVLEGRPHAAQWIRIGLRDLHQTPLAREVQALVERVERLITRETKAQSRRWVRIGAATAKQSHRLERRGRPWLSALARVGEVLCNVLASAVHVVVAYVRPPLIGNWTS